MSPTQQDDDALTRHQRFVAAKEHLEKLFENRLLFDEIIRQCFGLSKKYSRASSAARSVADDPEMEPPVQETRIAETF